MRCTIRSTTPLAAAVAASLVLQTHGEALGALVLPHPGPGIVESIRNHAIQNLKESIKKQKKEGDPFSVIFIANAHRGLVPDPSSRDIFSVYEFRGGKHCSTVAVGGDCPAQNVLSVESECDNLFGLKNLTAAKTQVTSSVGTSNGVIDTDGSDTLSTNTSFIERQSRRDAVVGESDGDSNSVGEARVEEDRYPVESEHSFGTIYSQLHKEFPNARYCILAPVFNDLNQFSHWDSEANDSGAMEALDESNHEMTSHHGSDIVTSGFVQNSRSKTEKLDAQSLANKGKSLFAKKVAQAAGRTINVVIVASADMIHDNSEPGHDFISHIPFQISKAQEESPLITDLLIPGSIQTDPKRSSLLETNKLTCSADVLGFFDQVLAEINVQNPNRKLEGEVADYMDSNQALHESNGLSFYQAEIPRGGMDLYTIQYNKERFKKSDSSDTSSLSLTESGADGSLIESDRNSFNSILPTDNFDTTDNFDASPLNGDGSSLIQVNSKASRSKAIRSEDGSVLEGDMQITPVRGFVSYVAMDYVPTDIKEEQIGEYSLSKTQAVMMLGNVLSKIEEARKGQIKEGWSMPDWVMPKAFRSKEWRDRNMFLHEIEDSKGSKAADNTNGDNAKVEGVWEEKEKKASDDKGNEMFFEKNDDKNDFRKDGSDAKKSGSVDAASALKNKGIERYVDAGKKVIEQHAKDMKAAQKAIDKERAVKTDVHGDRPGASKAATADVKTDSKGTDAKTESKARDVKSSNVDKAKEDSKGNADAEAKKKAEENAKADAEAKKKANAEAKKDADAKTKVDADAKAKSDTAEKIVDAKAKADAESKNDAKAKADAQAKADAKADDDKGKADNAKTDAAKKTSTPLPKPAENETQPHDTEAANTNQAAAQAGGKGAANQAARQESTAVNEAQPAEKPAAQAAEHPGKAGKVMSYIQSFIQEFDGSVVSSIEDDSVDLTEDSTEDDPNSRSSKKSASASTFRPPQMQVFVDTDIWKNGKWEPNCCIAAGGSSEVGDQILGSAQLCPSDNKSRWAKGNPEVRYGSIAGDEDDFDLSGGADKTANTDKAFSLSESDMASLSDLLTGSSSHSSDSSDSSSFIATGRENSENKSHASSYHRDSKPTSTFHQHKKQSKESAAMEEYENDLRKAAKRVKFDEKEFWGKDADLMMQGGETTVGRSRSATSAAEKYNEKSGLHIMSQDELEEAVPMLRKDSKNDNALPDSPFNDDGFGGDEVQKMAQRLNQEIPTFDSTNASFESAFKGEKTGEYVPEIEGSSGTPGSFAGEGSLSFGDNDSLSFSQGKNSSGSKSKSKDFADKVFVSMDSFLGQNPHEYGEKLHQRDLAGAQKFDSELDEINNMKLPAASALSDLSSSSPPDSSSLSVLSHSNGLDNFSVSSLPASSFLEMGNVGARNSVAGRRQPHHHRKDGKDGIDIKMMNMDDITTKMNDIAKVLDKERITLKPSSKLEKARPTRPKVTVDVINDDAFAKLNAIEKKNAEIEAKNRVVDIEAKNRTPMNLAMANLNKNATSYMERMQQEIKGSKSARVGDELLDLTSIQKDFQDGDLETQLDDLSKEIDASSKAVGYSGSIDNLGIDASLGLDDMQLSFLQIGERNKRIQQGSMVQNRARHHTSRRSRTARSQVAARVGTENEVSTVRQPVFLHAVGVDFIPLNAKGQKHYYDADSFISKYKDVQYLKDRNLGVRLYVSQKEITPSEVQQRTQDRLNATKKAHDKYGEHEYDDSATVNTDDAVYLPVVARDDVDDFENNMNNYMESLCRKALSTNSAGHSDIQARCLNNNWQKHVSMIQVFSSCKIQYQPKEGILKRNPDAREDLLVNGHPWGPNSMIDLEQCWSIHEDDEPQSAEQGHSAKSAKKKSLIRREVLITK